ncbi:peptidylprolyl isomerase [Candidatus Pelagibacter sp.]|nr:peptidylprolyl isomerase [Candidatus Pelagibacter sp.]
MNKIKFIYILIILSLITLNTKLFSDESVYIIYKVNNQIITNKDVEKEQQYLISLNSRLKELDEAKMLEVSKESALKEKIKKIELEKYFNFETLELNVDIYLENFYKTLNLNNKNEFEQYLKENNISLNYIKNKIQIEVLWNQLIYDRYISQINIDKNELKKKLQETYNNLDQKVYSLSEILFENEISTDFDKRLKDITQSISEVGFNNTANLYSVSDSAKFGGKIGWVEEKKLSKKIIEELQTLEAGQYTAPIQTGGLFLILKIEEIKYEKAKINEEEELNKMVQFETSKQLDQFSKIFYKKIKINNTIDEL